MSIRVHDLTRSFGKQMAVDHISFEARKKEITGFIGPNGAGKSTTMKILTGILPASSGSAFINDIDVSKNSLEIKSLVGYLPENNPLYPEMYVREYLTYVAGLYKNPIKQGKNGVKRLSQIIDLTGLGPEQNKKIQALSKGFKQRVGLAQAIIHDPPVLILDEPTSGLDPGQIVDIRNLIKNLGKEKTVMLSTHLMQEVEAICDRVVMISKGKIVADGSKQEVSALKEDDRIVILLEFDNEAMIKDMELLEGIQRVLALGKSKYLIESAESNDPRAELFKFAVKKGLTILSMQVKEKTLEETFQDLTKK